MYSILWVFRADRKAYDEKTSGGATEKLTLSQYPWL